MRRKIIIVLFGGLFTLLYLSSCNGEEALEVRSLEEAAQTSSVSSEALTQKNIEEETPDYWADKEVPPYAGTYNVIEKVGGNLLCDEIVRTEKGVIYKLRLQLQTSTPDTLISEDRSKLGYFYVQEKRILRIKDDAATAAQLQQGEIPEKSTVVFQEEETNDSLPATKKGFHEWIALEDGLIVYHSYENLVESGFYETFSWKKGVGLVAYRSGFGAGRDEINIQFTSNTVAPVDGLQPIIPQMMAGATRVWPK